MNNKKLCPLRRLPGGAFDYCQKERCVWYDPTKEICAIWLIADELRKLRWRLEDLVEATKK